MKLALQLAAKWKGYTNPNPVVGAVVVKNDRVIAQGAHRKAGAEHAEVLALQEAGKKAEGSTLYVTLEPCCHYGKTPPCTDIIIKSKVAKVIIAMKDPNPFVGGKGIEQLQKAGIEVEVGLLEKEAQKLNEVFIQYITTKKPFVILKAAISLDGKIATSTGDAKWISNDSSRAVCQKLRNEVDAIVVGRKTLLADNPRLNVRLTENPREPYKIVLSSGKDITPLSIKDMNVYKLSKMKPLLLTLPDDSSESLVNSYRELGVDVILLQQNNEGLDLESLLLELGKRGIASILLEGGSWVYSSFLRAGLVDKLYIFQAPIIIGEEGISWVHDMQFKKISECLHLRDVSHEMYKNNVLTCGYLKRKEV